MAEDPSGWSLTESDPQVFTQLLRDLGVKGLQVDDLYSLDSETLDTLKPIHALIFLFKWVGGGEEGEGKSGIPVHPGDTGVWFANQVINNSCGTLAALNAVMNVQPQSSPYPDEAIEHGPELENLREFGQAMESMDLGLALASHPLIREVHNSFSKSSPFSMDPSAFPDREKEDPYHFVAYVPINGFLHELDGLQTSPIMHGPIEGDNWLEQARETIQKRIETYPPGSVMFNLLAIRSAAIPRLTRLINDPSTPSHETISYQDQLEHERVKASRGERENSLRRHNLLPVVFALLKAMGQTGSIDKAVEQARIKGKERKEKAKQRGEEE